MQVERYLVHIEVYDNNTKKPIVLEQYNTNSLHAAERDLEQAAKAIYRHDMRGEGA